MEYHLKPFIKYLLLFKSIILQCDVSLEMITIHLKVLLLVVFFSLKSISCRYSSWSWHGIVSKKIYSIKRHFILKKFRYFHTEDCQRIEHSYVIHFTFYQRSGREVRSEIFCSLCFCAKADNQLKIFSKNQ